MAAEEQPQNIAVTVTEITERTTMLVREEIELAKAEVIEKLKGLVRGIAIGTAAGIFIITGLMFFLNGAAWAFYDFIFNHVSYGYFIVAGLLFVVGGLAGYFAAKWVKRGSPPVPEMAIEEARLIKETMTGSDAAPRR